MSYTQNAVFILGVPRSGTTLLRVLLNSHPAIVSLPETPWISGGYGRDFSLRQLVDYLCTDELGAAKNITGFDKSYAIKGARMFMESLLEDMITCTQADKIVFKTPDDMGQLEFLTSLCPDAKFLHIVRDGRDVACSSSEKIANAIFLKEYGQPTIENFLRRWKDWENKFKEYLTSEFKVCTISYENLVQNPTTTLKTITEFINVPFESSMLEYASKKHDYPAWEQGSQDVKSETSVHSRSVGRWILDIPYAQWNEIDKQFGEALADAGYATCRESLLTRPECVLQKAIHFEGALQRTEHLLNESNSKVDALSSSVENLKRELAQSHDDIRTGNAEILKLKQENLQTNIDKKRLHETIRDLNLRLQEDESNDIDTTLEMTNCRRQLADLDVQVSNLAQEITYHQQQSEETKNRLEVKTEECNSLNSDLKQLQERLDTVEKQKQFTIQEYDKLSAAHLALQEAGNEIRYKKKHWLRARLSTLLPTFSMPKPKPEFLTASQTQPGTFNSIPSRLNKIIHDDTLDKIEESDKQTAPTPLIRVASSRSKFAAGLNLGDQALASYGKHRSGWAFAVSGLVPLHNPDAIYFDTFVERTLRWHPDGPRPLLFPWIGVVHEPHNVPDWLSAIPGIGGNQWSFRQPVWQSSLKHCQGLFAMSEYSAKFLKETFPHLPISTLIHPTEFPRKTWSWEQFSANKDKAIIQVGWYLRNLHAIFELPKSSYRKLALPANKGEAFFEDLFRREYEFRKQNGLFFDSMYDTATMLGFLSNDEYDNLLSENILFLNLYDSSANNAVIECISRSTPLLVNPLPSVVEYLGVDYPLFYFSYQEAIDKACNFDLIRQAHEYLNALPIRDKMTRKAFRESILDSEVYKSIPKES